MNLQTPRLLLLLLQGRRCLRHAHTSLARKSPSSQCPLPASIPRCLSTAPARAPTSRDPTPPPTKTIDELATGPYVVRRTPSAQLPVYRQLRSGGNRVVVTVKKIDGDRRRLLEDMLQSLGLGQDEIRINPTTQHLEIKGDRHEKVRSWLLARGF